MDRAASITPRLSRRRLVRGLARVGLAATGLVLLAGCGPAPFGAAEPSVPKVPRIGVLAPNAMDSPAIEGLRQGLRELGYFEGQNIALEWRVGAPEESLPDLAAELVGLNVDLIVTGGGGSRLAAGRATGAIPIVMGQSADPIADGLVASLEHPGGNVTGLISVAPRIAARWVEILREVSPGATRLGYLHVGPPRSGPENVYVKSALAAAQPLGVQLQVQEASGPDDFERAFRLLSSPGVRGIVVGPHPFVLTYRNQIVVLEARNRLPTIYEFRELVQAGGLMAYGPSPFARYQRAAAFVDKILKGTPPGDIPIEPPTSFDFTVNQRTAQTLGLSLPQSLLAQVTETIQ